MMTTSRLGNYEFMRATEHSINNRPVCDLAICIVVCVITTDHVPTADPKITGECMPSCRRTNHRPVQVTADHQKELPIYHRPPEQLPLTSRNDRIMN